MQNLPRTEPLVYPPDEPYYYQTAPITARLSPALAHIERSGLAPVALGILAGAFLFWLGWKMHELFGHVYAERGWAALVVFSIVGSVWIVHTRENKQ